jgi:hypothetical protein
MKKKPPLNPQVLPADPGAPNDVQPPPRARRRVAALENATAAIEAAREAYAAERDGTEEDRRKGLSVLTELRASFCEPNAAAHIYEVLADEMTEPVSQTETLPWHFAKYEDYEPNIAEEYKRQSKERHRREEQHPWFREFMAREASFEMRLALACPSHLLTPVFHAYSRRARQAPIYASTLRVIAALRVALREEDEAGIADAERWAQKYLRRGGGSSGADPIPERSEIVETLMTHAQQRIDTGENRLNIARALVQSMASMTIGWFPNLRWTSNVRLIEDAAILVISEHDDAQDIVRKLLRLCGTSRKDTAAAFNFINERRRRGDA